MKGKKILLPFFMALLFLMGSVQVYAKQNVQIRLSATSVTLTKGKTKQLQATVIGTGKKPSWKTSNRSVAAVNAKGKITAKKKGTAVITCMVNKRKATCKVTVKNPAAVKVTLNKAKASVNVGASFTLKATVIGTSRKVAWSTSNSKVAVVKSGKVTGVGAGTAKIIATVGGKKVTCTVTVKKKASASGNASDKNEQHKKYVSYIRKFRQKNVDAFSEAIYRGLVSSSSSMLNTYFAFADIDGDGVDECIVRFGNDKKMTTATAGVRTEIYTIKNEKVKKVVEQGEYGRGSYPQIGVYKGSNLIEFYTTGHMRNINQFYTFQAGSLGSRAKCSCEGSPDGDYVNEVRTTAENYTAFLNKMKKGKTGYPMYLYTTANLNKFL